MNLAGKDCLFTDNSNSLILSASERIRIMQSAVGKRDERACRIHLPAPASSFPKQDTADKIYSLPSANFSAQSAPISVNSRCV